MKFASWFLLAACSMHGETAPVVLVSQGESIQVFDTGNLDAVGAFYLPTPAYRLAATPDGRQILTQLEWPKNGCCALFAVDLISRTAKKLLDPSSQPVTTSGGLVLNQRGPIGIEVFDGPNLDRLPTIDARGAYSFSPSSDGRWMFGTTQQQRGDPPTLDLFDLTKRQLIRRYPREQAEWLRGAWVGSKFILYAWNGADGRLWHVDPESERLSEPISVALPPQDPAPPIIHQVLGTPDSLLIYEPAGWKLDRRTQSGARVLDGMLVVDPSTGGVLRHLIPTVPIMNAIVSQDGRMLFAAGLSTLFKVDIASGAVLAQHSLGHRPLGLSIASLPQNVLPRGRVKIEPAEAASLLLRGTP